MPNKTIERVSETCTVCGGYKNYIGCAPTLTPWCKCKKEGQAKIVKWRDSRLYIQQVEGDGDWDVCEIESVGFVIHEDKDKLVLAGDLVEGDVRRVVVIPKENIIKIKK